MIARRREVAPIVSDWSTWGMLLGELAWLGVLATAGWRLGQGWWLGAVEAVAFVAAFAAAWARWMAPKSRRRLDAEDRILVLVLLGSVITILGSSAGLLVPAVAASVMVVVAHRRHHKVTHPAPDLRNAARARRNDV